MSFDQAQFGRTLRQVRKDAGLNQEQLAGRLGCSTAAVSQAELGQVTPSVARLAAFAEVLGVSVGVLFGDRVALAEYVVAEVRAEVRALGFNLALIPREPR